MDCQCNSCIFKQYHWYWWGTVHKSLRWNSETEGKLRSTIQSCWMAFENNNKETSKRNSNFSHLWLDRQNRQLKGKVIIITDLSIIPCHEGAWSTQRQSKTVIRVPAAESSALRLNYCCTTNIFALHVDIIIDQQSVMISNWSVIINTVQ